MDPALAPSIILAGLGILVTCSLIPLIRKLAATDPRQTSPCFHHTNSHYVPRLGGIALAAAFLTVAIAALFFSAAPKLAHNLTIIVSCLFMFSLGLWDDFRPLGAKIKLAGQICIALLAYIGGLQIEVIKNPFTAEVIQLGGWALPATVCWLVAFTNLVNLIDGIDGLAGGIALMLMTLLAYAGFGNHAFGSYVAIGMAAALAGFLYFNFPPARIYMGDGGAYLLGFLIGVLTISTSQKGTVAAGLIAPLFALALPIIDVGMAILRRALRGLPIFRADRKHIHHRLIEAGLSRRTTVLVLYGLSLIGVLMAFGAFWSQGKLIPILFGALFLVFAFAGRLLGLFRNCCRFRTMLGTSLQLRKESRYALAMMAWLEMEAERTETIQELWTSYLFLTRKLGFAYIRPILDSNTNQFWQSPTPLLETPNLRRTRHEFRIGNIRGIEFTSNSTFMSQELFEHLTELAAEAWIKAAQRWNQLRGNSVIFEAAVLQSVPVTAAGRVLVANAA